MGYVVPEGGRSRPCTRGVPGASRWFGGGSSPGAEVQGALGAGKPMGPGSGGQASGCDTATPLVGGWTLEELDASEHAFPAVGTQTQSPGQEIEEPLTVLSVLSVWPGHRFRLTESVPTAGEELGTGSVGKKAVVTDPDEALGEHVEEEAADELPKREGQSSDPLATILLETERDGPVVDMK